MTPPKDPQNPRHKSLNSSRPSTIAADALLESELVDHGDGRWKYRDDCDGKRQTDLSLAKRAGCNESYVAKTRRRDYGNLVPQQSEASKAARRGKPFGTPYKKKVTPQFVYPDASSASGPKPTPEINTAPDPINIGSMGDLKRVLDRIGQIEIQNRLIEIQNREVLAQGKEMLTYLMVLYAAWKPVEAPMLLDIAPRAAA